jgi:orotate phosphoribosyltransferase
MEISRKLASNLLQIKAIKINAQNLFVWASGIHSPIYCDNRLALSYPNVREMIIHGFVELSKKFDNIDYIAGVATAGIPWGALLADRLQLPFVYIRSNAKSHGRQNKIEGELKTDKNVLVIEDLISTGGSSLQAVEAIRENDNKVLGVLAIFSYNLKKAEIKFKEAECDFLSISNYDILIEEAKKQKYISSGEFQIIKEWKTDPENWFKNLKYE